ncbi:GerAB/ArcD/ProY family transporter [Bacillus sp. 165]|uniref:GerAB/ArcD/ProY family transporter n=1 Tax=Bacillus sp. 165 TaxID=1529117 RepID=UPI001FFE1D70|nr:GerAB/ArcD/ProY family transporter [Bacillus sp. 165]
MKKVPVEYQVSPSVVFFLVNSLQVGVGILGFGRIVAKMAGNDGWISVLIAGITVNIAIWVIYKLLKDGSGGIIAIHQELFGKWFGNILSLVFILYLFLANLTIIRTYVEVIQVWMFPFVPTWVFVIVILMLAYYVVSGGFRVVAGICFFWSYCSKLVVLHTFLCD